MNVQRLNTSGCSRTLFPLMRETHRYDVNVRARASATVCVRVRASANVCVRLRARADDRNRSCTGVHARTSTRIPRTLFLTRTMLTCARIYVRVEFQAASRTRPLACACVRVCLRALAGCCVYASAAKDASIARTHLERRRAFCSRNFRMYYMYIYMYIVHVHVQACEHHRLVIATCTCSSLNFICIELG